MEKQDGGKEDQGKKAREKGLQHSGGEGKGAESRDGGGQAHHVEREGEEIVDQNGGLREMKGLAMAGNGSRVAGPAAADAQGEGNRVFGVEYMFALADTVTGQVSVPTEIASRLGMDAFT